MEHGLSFLPDADPTSKSAIDYYRDALEMAGLADEAGLSTVKITEHYAQAYGGYCPDPLMFLTAVGQRTRQIRLMTGCLLPVFHHPVQLACRIALADVLSGGRLDIGFARAFLPDEFAMLGVPLDESRVRYKAVIGAIRALFLDDAASAATPFFEYDDVTLMPKPVQRPHPPIWGAAARSRESFAWIGAQGFNLLTAFTIQKAEHLAEQIALYRETRADAGHARPGRIAMLIPLFLNVDDTVARQRGAAYLERYHAVWAAAASSWRGKSSSAYPGYGNLDKQISQVSVDELFANNALAFGDPARIRDYADWIRDSFGVDQVLWNVDFGAMSGEEALPSARLLIDKVITA